MLKIVSVAIRRGKLIFSIEAPARHHHVLHTMDLQEKIDAIDVDQGFLTNEGKFVDREEAFKIALAANQLLAIHPLKELFSEDIW
jgi:hypothetical protein